MPIHPLTPEEIEEIFGDGVIVVGARKPKVPLGPLNPGGSFFNKESLMTRVVENGRITSVVVEHAGSKFNIWRFDRDQPEYEVFCNQKGGLSITFSGEDASELQSDLNALNSGALTKQRLEDKLAVKIDGFLDSIKT